MGEENCYWLLPNGRVASLGGHDGYMGFTERTAGLTGGVQGQLAPYWYLDVGAGYSSSSIGTDTSSANGDVFRGGAALKYIRDNWLVAGSVSGSHARYNTSRYGIPIPAQQPRPPTQARSICGCVSPMPSARRHSTSNRSLISTRWACGAGRSTRLAPAR